MSTRDSDLSSLPFTVSASTDFEVERAVDSGNRMFVRQSIDRMCDSLVLFRAENRGKIFSHCDDKNQCWQVNE